MKGLKILFCNIVLSLIVVVSIFTVPAKATYYRKPHRG